MSLARNKGNYLEGQCLNKQLIVLPWFASRVKLCRLSVSVTRTFDWLTLPFFSFGSVPTTVNSPTSAQSGVPFDLFWRHYNFLMDSYLASCYLASKCNHHLNPDVCSGMTNMTRTKHDESYILKWIAFFEKYQWASIYDVMSLWRGSQGFMITVPKPKYFKAWRLREGSQIAENCVTSFMDDP